MNGQMQQFARQTLKDGLAKCTERQIGVFKRMYSFKDQSLSINDIVDNMPCDQLDWAMEQVQAGNPNTGGRVMSFDMEPDHDEHAECRREIKALQGDNARLRGSRWSRPMPPRRRSRRSNRTMRHGAGGYGRSFTRHRSHERSSTSPCLPW